MKKAFDKIYIEITNVCNLNCAFCPKSEKEKIYMSTENFQKTICKIKSYTDLIALHVKGEPLIHPHLKKLLQICDENKIKVNITTNGTYLMENIEILNNATYTRQINISLHSYKENTILNKDYINKVIEAANKLNKYISFRLWNLEDLKQNDENTEILNILGKIYKVENIVERAKKEKFIELKKKVFLNQDMRFTWPDINGKKINNCGKCYGLRNQIAILANGDVVPCCLDGEGSIKLGNIYIQTLEEILSSEKVNNMIKGFEKGILVEDLCKTCGFIKKFKEK